MPDARDALAKRFGFAGSARALRDLLSAMEDLGTDEFLLLPTAIDPDEVDRIAEILGR